MEWGFFFVRDASINTKNYHLCDGKMFFLFKYLKLKLLTLLYLFLTTPPQPIIRKYSDYDEKCKQTQ